MTESVDRCARSAQVYQRCQNAWHGGVGSGAAWYGNTWLARLGAAGCGRVRVALGRQGLERNLGSRRPDRKIGPPSFQARYSAAFTPSPLRRTLGAAARDP